MPFDVIFQDHYSKFRKIDLLQSSLTASPPRLAIYPVIGCHSHDTTLKDADLTQGLAKLQAIIPFLDRDLTPRDGDSFRDNAPQSDHQPGRFSCSLACVNKKQAVRIRQAASVRGDSLGLGVDETWTAPSPQTALSETALGGNILPETSFDGSSGNSHRYNRHYSPVDPCAKADEF